MDIEQTIKDRVRKRVPFELFRALGIDEFYVGGNSLNRQAPNDIDIFPVNGKFIYNNDFIKVLGEIGGEVITKTKNAATIRFKDQTIQFCNYHHDSLRSLVESFDFSHIKLGVKICCNDVDANLVYYIDDVYISNDWKNARQKESTEFTGSAYPLSSLIRSYKYMKRGDFAGKSYMWETLKILVDMVKRGFSDYDDFKDQLDAVDLGLLPEDMKDMDKSVLSELFDLLRRDT